LAEYRGWDESVHRISALEPGDVRVGPLYAKSTCTRN
jgi:hypothetical protein